MVSRYALMLDGGSRGRPKPVVEHLTCGACQGHHVTVVGAPVANGYRTRASEQGAFARPAVFSGSDSRPTLQCRDCGLQWVKPGP